LFDLPSTYSFFDLSSNNKTILHRLSSSTLKKNRAQQTMSFKYLQSMELLIYEFLITFPFLLSFLFVLKLSIESSKGIYSIFIMAFPF
jgi:hypothetical protein